MTLDAPPRPPLPIKQMVKVSLAFSVFLGTISLYPALHRHNFKQESPIFATSAQAHRWVDRLQAGPASHCLPHSIDTQFVGLAQDEGWFATFRCNTPQIYWRIATIYIGIALGVFAVIAMALRWPKKRH
jgi:hypothetical protein